MLTGRLAAGQARAGIKTIKHKTEVITVNPTLQITKAVTSFLNQGTVHFPRAPTIRTNNAETGQSLPRCTWLNTASNQSYHRRHFSTSSKMADISSERMIHSALQSYGHTRWGFVFYRTSYTPASESLWPRFQTILVQTAHDIISHSDMPELLDGFEHKFVSDAARLNNVGVDVVQRIHAEWRTSPAAQAEQPEGSASVWPSDIPRYKHCVQADEETMRSVVEGPQPPEVDYDGNTFVKFLHCDWPDDQDNTEAWMLLASWMMATDAYDIFHDANINWYNFWEAPPTVVNH